MAWLTNFTLTFLQFDFAIASVKIASNSLQNSQLFLMVVFTLVLLSFLKLPLVSFSSSFSAYVSKVAWSTQNVVLPLAAILMLMPTSVLQEWRKMGVNLVDRSLPFVSSVGKVKYMVSSKLGQKRLMSDSRSFTITNLEELGMSISTLSSGTTDGCRQLQSSTLPTAIDTKTNSKNINQYLCWITHSLRLKRGS